MVKAASPLWPLQKFEARRISSSTKNHHFLTNFWLNSHPIGSQGIVPHTLILPIDISCTNSTSLIADCEFKSRSRIAGHGSISTYALCGTTSCCEVGIRDGGKLDFAAHILKPELCVQASSSLSAIHRKAVQEVMSCMRMKWLSRAGSSDTWRWFAIVWLRIHGMTESVDCDCDCWDSVGCALDAKPFCVVRSEKDSIRGGPGVVATPPFRPLLSLDPKCCVRILKPVIM